MTRSSTFPERPRLLRRTSNGVEPFDNKDMESLISVSGPRRRWSFDITFADYFSAVNMALKSNWGFIESLCRELRDKECDHMAFNVDIISEKHGSHYHPARIDIKRHGSKLSLAANVAVSEPGLSRIETEYDAMKRLFNGFRKRYIPEPHFLYKDQFPGSGDNINEVKILFTKWLDGYHEFHICESEDTNEQALILWDTENGYSELPAVETHEVYKRASAILTYYFDPETSEEIFPWHHGAGDFVAQRRKRGVSVRLISVRQYAGRVVSQNERVEPVEALITFFANLTVRMRLDRVDGVGEIVWANDEALIACIEGFFNGVSMKAHEMLVDRELAEKLIGVISKMGPGDWAEVFARVLDSYDQESPDDHTIKEGIVDHIYLVYKTLSENPWEREFNWSC